MIVVIGAVGCAVGTVTGGKMGVICMRGVLFSMQTRERAAGALHSRRQYAGS